MAQSNINAFEKWLIGRELSPNTVRAYVCSMRAYFTIFPEASQENGASWKRCLLESGMKPTSINLRLCAFNAYCKMNGIPVEIRRLKIQQGNAVENVISVEEYQRLLGCLNADGDSRRYWMVKLLALTGARVSEAVKLTKADLDRGYAEMWTKGKIRRIYIPKSLQEAPLWSDLQPNETLLKSRFNAPISREGVRASLQDMAAKYQIDKRVMHPHSFRHLFAMQFLGKTGNNLSLLADVLGHSSVATTAIYTRMTKEQQAAAVNSAVTW